MRDTGLDRQTSAAIDSVKGKTISGLHIVDGSELHIQFTDGDAICISDTPRCCENRWMYCDDDLPSFIGSTFEGIELRDGPDIDDVDSNENCHESGFLIGNTSLGQFTVVTHNEHNGWYGGFYITATRLTETAS